MELLLKYHQIKKEKKFGLDSTCDVKLFGDKDFFEYNSHFIYKYLRLGQIKTLIIEHVFKLSINDGGIEITHKISNDGLISEKTYVNYCKSKKNNFQMLKDLIKNSFIRGEKKHGYWGIKYSRCHNKIIKIITEHLSPKFNNSFFTVKYADTKVSNLFDYIVDYHLDRRKIKPHNNVYNDIIAVYPRKKWLARNENKFLPSVLESKGLKKKYLISELNKNSRNINILTLNYLCKLFGENFIDYLKLIDWKLLCMELLTNKKIHHLKNESEKKCLIIILNKWAKKKENLDDIMNSINRLLELRKNLEKNGLKLKFNPRSIEDYETINENWLSLKAHLSRGYKYCFNFPVNFVDEIEEPIIIDNQVFIPKILKTEEEYKIEGVIMKNCMGKQFTNGLTHIYVSLQSKNKRINLQYRKGVLTQCFGKANSKPTEEFKKPINVLNKRFQNHIDVLWTKQKYDFLK